MKYILIFLYYGIVHTVMFCIHSLPILLLPNLIMNFVYDDSKAYNFHINLQNLISNEWVSDCIACLLDSNSNRSFNCKISNQN